MTDGPSPRSRARPGSTDPPAPSDRSVTQQTPRREWQRHVHQVLQALEDAGVAKSVITARQLVLLAVAVEMRTDGTRAVVSNERLRESTRLAERTLRRALTWCVDDAHLLTRERGNRFRKASVYAARVPANTREEWPGDDDVQRPNDNPLPATPDPVAATDPPGCTGPSPYGPSPHPHHAALNVPSTPTAEEAPVRLVSEELDQLAERHALYVAARAVVPAGDGWPVVPPESLHPALAVLAAHQWTPEHLDREPMLRRSMEDARDTRAVGFARLRQLAEDVQAGRPLPLLDRDPVVTRPPSCGKCDQNRQVEDADGRMARCPACHPLKRSA